LSRWFVTRIGQTSKLDGIFAQHTYPQVAQYTGSGSTDEAANFVCKAPGGK